MENILVLEKTKIFTDFVQSQPGEKLFIPEPSRINHVLENIRTEGGEDFYQYLQWLQLTKKPNLLALSSTHHYYYESNDLKRIKTLVNLKKLNIIKHLESFLRIVVRILPQKANFIGFFKSNNQDRSSFSVYQPSELFNRLVNFIDSRTERSLTKKDVSRLLEEHNLKVVDITEINGMTYFCSQK
jgi:hypothetical protein